MNFDICDSVAALGYYSQELNNIIWHNLQLLCQIVKAMAFLAPPPPLPNSAPGPTPASNA